MKLKEHTKKMNKHPGSLKDNGGRKAGGKAGYPASVQL
jgi:hypothetical protein